MPIPSCKPKLASAELQAVACSMLLHQAWASPIYLSHLSQRMIFSSW